MISKIHRRYVHGIYALLAFSILTLAASFLTFGIRPLTHQLQVEHDQNLQQFLHNHARLIQANIDKHFDICRQAAARTGLRHALHDHLLGRMSQARLGAMSRPQLLDLVRYNGELLGIARFDRDLHRIVELGLPADPAYQLDRLPDGNLIQMRGPVDLGEARHALLYYSPILQEDSGILGYDLLQMDTENIQRVVNSPYANFGNLYLVRRGEIVYRPAPDSRRIPPHIIEAFLQEQLLDEGYIVESTPIAYTDWTLYLVVDQARSLGTIERSINFLIGFIIGATVLIFIISAVVLRPIIRALMSHQQLYEMSYRDGLTGLFNHRHFQNVMDQEVTRADRYGNPLSVLMIDIDHFKQINDTYGHQSGDDVLKKVSAVISATVRTTDMAARYGGEEFAVVLPETGNTPARKLAERLRRNAERAETLVRGMPLRVTVSVGLATYSPVHGRRGKGDIIQAADRALYHSKAAGRNRLTDAGDWQRAPERTDDPAPRITPLRERE